MFKQDDKLVYPGYGVAVVEEIIEKSVGSENIIFLNLRFLYKDMTILVPAYNVKNIGLRLPSDEAIVQTVMQELNTKPERQLETVDFTPSGWNRRQKSYQLKIQSGLLIEITKIYRDLMYISKQKELSFGERALLQTTEDLMVQEMQVVNNLPTEEIVQTLRAPFRSLLVDTQESIYESKQSTQQLF